jgi:hypothetical protein
MNHMIDSKHRLRKERVVKHNASIFKDLKFFAASVWKTLFCRKQKTEYFKKYGSTSWSFLFRHIYIKKNCKYLLSKKSICPWSREKRQCFDLSDESNLCHKQNERERKKCKFSRFSLSLQKIKIQKKKVQNKTETPLFFFLSFLTY